jgi:tape measure domain-containing protein
VELFKLFGRIMIEDDAASKSLQRIDNQAENTANRFGRLGSLGAQVGGLIAAGAKAATAAVGVLSLGVGKVGLSYNAMSEQSAVAWKTLLGTQEEAQKMLQQISDFTKATPFETEEVDAMAKYMHNAGLEGKALFDELLKVSDVASAFAVPAAEAKEMTRQMSQVRQAGVAYTEDLNILQDRGVPIYKAIADQLGITTGEVKKMAGEGKLTSDIYLQAFDSIAKGAEGASEAQSKTFNGMISTLKDNLKMISGELTRGLFERLKGTFETVMPIIETFLDNLKNGGLKEAVLGLIPPETLERLTSFANTAQSTFEKVKAFAMPIIKEVVDFVGKEVEKLRKFWDENGAQILEACKIAFEGIKAVIEFVMPAVLFIVKMVWENIKGVINGALNIIMGVIKVFTGLLTGDFSKMWEGVKQLFIGALEFLWNLINLLMIGKLLGGIKAFITGGINLFASFGSSVVATVRQFIDDIINWFGYFRSTGSSIWGAALDTIKNLVQILKSSIKGQFDEILSVATSIFNKVKNAITNPIETARNVVSGLVDDIKGFIGKIKIPETLSKLKIPGFAVGTNYAPGGLALVGEKGPELVNLPRGSKVSTANETKDVLKSGGGNTYNFYPQKAIIDEKEVVRSIQRLEVLYG